MADAKSPVDSGRRGSTGRSSLGSVKDMPGSNPRYSMSPSGRRASHQEGDHARPGNLDKVPPQSPRELTGWEQYRVVFSTVSNVLCLAATFLFAMKVPGLMAMTSKLSLLAWFSLFMCLACVIIGYGVMWRAMGGLANGHVAIQLTSVCLFILALLCKGAGVGAMATVG